MQESFGFCRTIIIPEFYGSELKETSQIREVVDYGAFMTETGIDEDTLIEIYEVFRDELLGEKEKLPACLSRNDYVKLGKIVHNIKGISGSYKAGKVFVQASLIDLDLKEGKYEGIHQNLSKLTDEIEAAALDIKQRFSIL